MLMKQLYPVQFSPRQRLSKQRGISLLLTVVVLLGLTIIAITITNSNQTQSILVRNNQFRLEAFNASYTEIDAQIDAINQRTIAAGPPEYVNVLISGNLNDSLDAGDSGLELLAKAAEASQPDESTDLVGNVQASTTVDASAAGAGNDGLDGGSDEKNDFSKAVGINRGVSQVYRGPCQVVGEEIGVTAASIVCSELRVDSDVNLANTNVGSSQRQVYEYRSLGQ